MFVVQKNVLRISVKQWIPETGDVLCVVEFQASLG